MSDDRPIGLFDSGVGGLTVLHAVQRALPTESTIYLGDLARCPYGTRPQSEVREFAVEIGDLLADLNVKLLVIACNTATAAAFDTLQKRYSFPVIGVIEPGVRAALTSSQRQTIGVIATDGTVASGAYRNALHARAGGAVTVHERSASWLVPIIEWGPLARPVVAERLGPVMSEMQSLRVDALILGCTHFPLVRDIFEDAVQHEMAVIDSASTTAAEVAAVLSSLDMFSTSPPRHRLLVTGPAAAFAERTQAMFRTSTNIESIGATAAL